MNKFEYLINKIVSFIFTVLPHSRPTMELLKSAKLVAHRGVHENNIARENSMESFEIAAQNNLWGIEFDIRFTRDLIPIVHHDAHCGRLFQRPDLKISDLRFVELRAFVPQIPTLQEVIDRYMGRLHFMIEIKEDMRNRRDMQSALQIVLQKISPQKDYHLLCLNPDFLSDVQFCPPQAMLDVIWLSPQEIFAKNAKLNHGAIAGHFLFIGSDQIKSLQAQGKMVGVGFLDSKNSLYREINRGVDFIFTNHPLRLKRYLDTP